MAFRFQARHSRRSCGQAPPDIASRHLDRLCDWKEIPESWLILPRKETWANEVARRSSAFRDELMVKLLVDQVKKGERVIAVVDSSHVVVQEPALRFGLKGICDLASVSGTWLAG